MSLLSQLERRFQRFAVPNLTVYLLFGQVCTYIIGFAQRAKFGESKLLDLIELQPGEVLHGQWWRVVTFLVDPMAYDPVWMIVGAFFFYFVGTVMEAHWGAFRYNVYLLVGWIATVAAALLIGVYEPEVVASNRFLYGSVFLAFAMRYPEVPIYVMFVLPVKAKILGLLSGVGYAWAFFQPGWINKATVAAALANFVLFFWPDIVAMARTGQRRMKHRAQVVQDRDKPFHVCAACGITDRTHPKMDFRYCPMCFGSWGYCAAHIHDHVHKTAPPAEA